jgi:hypothetical protein
MGRKSVVSSTLIIYSRISLTQLIVALKTPNSHLGGWGWQPRQREDGALDRDSFVGHHHPSLAQPPSTKRWNP